MLVFVMRCSLVVGVCLAVVLCLCVYLASEVSVSEQAKLLMLVYTRNKNNAYLENGAFLEYGHENKKCLF